MAAGVHDAHRHIGALPAFPFYGGPAIRADLTAKETVKAFLAGLDEEGTERTLVLPNHGVPTPDVAFGLNELALEAAQADERVRCGLWISPKPSDADRNTAALALAGEAGVAALKTSFLLGGSVEDEGCLVQLDRLFAAAKEHDLTVHVHTSPGGASDIDRIGTLVDRWGDDVRIHLVHLGGGMSGHMKLIGGRFFDWISAGKRVYTDTSWAIGFAPRWLAAEIGGPGIGHDPGVVASDEPWGDVPGEYARLAAAAGDGELATQVFGGNFAALYPS